MFTKTRARMFARQNKNSRTKLTFPSLLTPSVLTEQKKEKTSLDVLAKRHISPSNLECKELNSGPKNFTYTITA